MYGTHSCSRHGRRLRSCRGFHPDDLLAHTRSEQDRRAGEQRSAFVHSVKDHEIASKQGARANARASHPDESRGFFLVKKAYFCYI